MEGTNVSWDELACIGDKGTAIKLESIKKI
jgi:hypothetical protein